MRARGGRGLPAKPTHIGITVRVINAGVAVRDVEALLGKLKARKIEKQSHDGREVLTAVINAQDLGGLIEKLKTVGETEERGIPSSVKGQDVPIMVEIFLDQR